MLVELLEDPAGSHYTSQYADDDDVNMPGASHMYQATGSLCDEAPIQVFIFTLYHKTLLFSYVFIMAFTQNFIFCYSFVIVISNDLSSPSIMRHDFCCL